MTRTSETPNRARSSKGRLFLGTLAVAALTVLGWGYWHASSHATLHVSLYDVALKNERQAYGQVLAADLVFKDASGTMLAKGKASGPYGVVSVEHPQVGDCRREEQATLMDAAARSAWRQCFETQSRWLTTWVPELRSADVNFGDCRIARAPVSLRASKGDWWLWWLPLPHSGGPPYTYLDATLWVDSARCAAAADR
jgi:hypothetical protein